MRHRGCLAGEGRDAGKRGKCPLTYMGRRGGAGKMPANKHEDGRRTEGRGGWGEGVMRRHGCLMRGRRGEGVGGRQGKKPADLHGEEG